VNGRAREPGGSTPELFVSDAGHPPRMPDEAQRAHRETPARADAPPGTTPATAVSVAVLNTTIKAVLEGAFAPIWVRGEVSGFKRHRSGHWYFSLRDSEDAIIPCVMWATEARRLPAPLSDGMIVIALCTVSMYTVRGEVQVVVRRVRPDGDGEWRKAFDAVRQRLETDGLLDPARKRPLPRFPRTVAIITSADGAALHDIVKVAHKRCPNVQLVLIAATVQGESAAQSLRRALTRLRKWGGADVLIIGRGGGSREDLWCFNDERLARALAECPIPTISAVGHETDVTICDLVADVRAPTPSAAAQLAVPELEELRSYVAQRAQAMERHVRRLTQLGHARLSALSRTLMLQAHRALEARRARVESFARELNALSPLATLGRGYAAVFGADDRAITGVAQVHSGDDVRVRLRDGSFAAQVDSVAPAEESAA
jgi:exodeoxyribonuclease VII large subunit